MLGTSTLHHHRIMTWITQHYRITVAHLEELPLGNDARAAVYRIDAADATAYFLKITHGPIYPPAMVIPRYLQDHGIAAVVAPLRTKTQTLWEAIDGLIGVLYPFIDGVSGMERDLADQQWIMFGALLRAIHQIPLPPPLRRQLRRDGFVPPWSVAVQHLHAAIRAHVGDDPVADDLAGFWEARQPEIDYVIERAAVLGRMLLATSAAGVLCHGDSHLANVMVDPQHEVHLVDWDYPMLAPKERDLRFVVGSVVGRPVSSHQEAWFFKGYGPIAIDPIALAYYRYERAIQDLAEYGTRVFGRANVAPLVKHAAAESLRARFQPGNIIESAYHADPG